MTLRKHPSADVFGRPVYSLEIPESLYVMLQKKPQDWPEIDSDRPLSVLVLGNFTTSDKSQLRPLAAWLCSVDAIDIATWGGNASTPFVDYAVLCDAIYDYDGEMRLDVFAQAIIEDGLDVPEAGDAVAAAHGSLEVYTWHYGPIELDDALKGFLFSVEMSEQGRASRSVVVVSIGNAEWSAAVRQRLDDEEWLPKYDSNDETS